MTDPYLRPGKILSTFGHLYPNAWKLVDEFRAKRRELGRLVYGTLWSRCLASKRVQVKGIEEENECHSLSMMQKHQCQCMHWNGSSRNSASCCHPSIGLSCWLHNGGRPVPNQFRFKKEQGPYTDSIVDWFLAIYEGEYDNFEQYFQTYKIEDDRVPEHLVPIAHDPGGNLVCISVSGSDVGAVLLLGP